MALSLKNIRSKERRKAQFCLSQRAAKRKSIRRKCKRRGNFGKRIEINLKMSIDIFYTQKYRGSGPWSVENREKCVFWVKTGPLLRQRAAVPRNRVRFVAIRTCLNLLLELLRAVDSARVAVGQFLQYICRNLTLLDEERPRKSALKK